MPNIPDPAQWLLKIAALDVQVPLSRRVYWAFRETADEAKRRKHAVAVLVDAAR